MFSRASESRTSTLHQAENAELDDEPGEDEVREYADTIGIDVDNEPELMWIARAGITAPMPSDEWRPVETSTGDLYFFNFKTKESSWEHPSDEKYRKMVNEERKRLQMRPKSSQQPSSPAANAKKQSPSKSNQAVSEPPQPTNPIRPLGRLQPIGSAPLANQSNPTPNPSRLAPLTETQSATNTAALSRPSTSRGQRPSTSIGQRPSSTPTGQRPSTTSTPQPQQANKEPPAKPVTPQSNKNVSPAKESPVGFTLGGGSRFLKGNTPPPTKQEKEPTMINGAEVLTFTPHGERLNLIADIASLEESDSDETESSSTESPLDLRENLNKPLAAMIPIVQTSSQPPPKSALINKADKSEKSSSSTTSEKRVSFEIDMKNKEAEIRKEYDERLNKLKQDFEQQQKRQEAELSAMKRQLQTTHAKQLEASKKDSEEKLKKELSALEANERAQLDQMEKDIANRRQILKDRFDRELNDDKADYESKLAKARREWKAKMAAEETKLAAEFREVTQMERETAKQRLAAGVHHPEKVMVDRAVATDIVGAPVASTPSRPKLEPIQRPPVINAASQTTIGGSKVEDVATKLEVKLHELTTATSELQNRMSELGARAKQIVAEPPGGARHASSKTNKTGDDSLDDLVSLVTNGNSIKERVVDNAEDIVRRAKELLESPDKKSFGREHDLLIDSGFDRSMMSDRALPPSTAAVVQASLRQLQQDLRVLSINLTGHHSNANESQNRTALDVESFIDEKWLGFSSERVDEQPLPSYLPNRLLKTTTTTDNVEDKLADLKAWLSAFESHLNQSKF